MKRLGFYTGRIYTQKDFDEDKIHECCLVISDEEAENEDYLAEKIHECNLKCRHCYGCPESQL